MACFLRENCHVAGLEGRDPALGGFKPLRPARPGGDIQPFPSPISESEVVGPAHLCLLQIFSQKHIPILKSILYKKFGECPQNRTGRCEAKPLPVCSRAGLHCPMTPIWAGVTRPAEAEASTHPDRSECSLQQPGALTGLVGAAGFEPATSCSQGKRASQAAPRSEKRTGAVTGDNRLPGDRQP